MKKTALALLAVLALVGCGNDRNDQPQYGLYPGGQIPAPGTCGMDPFQMGGYPNQFGGIPQVQGYCAPEVINAYNNFQRQCDLSQFGFGGPGFRAGNMNFQPCRFSAEHFIRLYPNISCVVAPMGQGGFGGYNNGPYGQFYPNYGGQQVFHITTFPMRNMLRYLEQIGAAEGQCGNQWQPQYPRWPQVRL